MTAQLLKTAIQNPISGRRLALYAGASLGMVLGLSGVAAAQQASDDEIVVTGSRIRGVDPVGSAVIGLDREEIVAAGAPTTGDLIRELPAVISLGANEVQSAAAFAQNGAANLTRSTNVNLRGLGAQSTLTLLNGRRLPAAGLQAQLVDASVIPSNALERLEVVADGGSAIYGSDAVAGVVNMITRSRFVGQETSARYGFADGYTDWQVGHIAGFKWDSGRAMVAGNYNEHSELLGKDRDFYKQDLRAQGGSDFRGTNCSPGTITVAGRSPIGVQQTVSGLPVTYAIPAGGVTSANAATLTPGTSNRCDNSGRDEIVTPLERTSFLGTIEQELSPNFTVFAEGFWSRRKFDQNAGTGGTFTISRAGPNANPNYPVDLRGLIGTPDLSVAYDLFPESGHIRQPGHAQSWQSVVGFRANLPAEWQLEMYASLGESEDMLLRDETNVRTPPVNSIFNPFNSGPNSATTLRNARRGSLTTYGETKLTDVGVQFDGPLFAMGGGEARLAIGGEYREERLDGVTRIQTGPAPLVTTVTSNSRDSWAAFSEIFLPFVGEGNAVPGIERLDLLVAARYEEYSSAGSTLNPKVGLVWTPFSAIDVRGSWGKSFRAPGLNESDRESSGYGIYSDTLPCNNPLPGFTNCTGISITGGNPDLKPESAETWSAGFDFHPEALPGFNASVSYFNIDYTDQIITIRNAAGLLTSPLYASYRTLNPTQAQVNAVLALGYPQVGQLPPVVEFIADGRASNVGSTLVSGIDFDVNQRFDIGESMLNFGISGTYYTKYEQSLVQGAAPFDVLNLINFPQEFRARGNVGWRSGPFTARATINYTGAYEQQRTPRVEISSNTTVDLNFGYEVPIESGLASGISLGLDVTNVADEDPPFVNQSGGYDPQSASATGRLIAVSLRKAW